MTYQASQSIGAAIHHLADAADLLTGLPREHVITIMKQLNDMSGRTVDIENSLKEVALSLRRCG